jgi:hypothetical protein
MFKSAPVRRGISSWLGQFASLAWILAIGLSPTALRAQDGLRLEAIDVQSLPGQQVELRLRLNGPAPEPMSFTIDDPRGSRSICRIRRSACSRGDRRPTSAPSPRFSPPKPTAARVSC